MTQVQMKLVGKISAKTVCGKVPTQAVEVPDIDGNGNVIVKDGKPVMKVLQKGIKQNLMRVFGQCDGVKPIITQYGTSIEFSGQFEATNALTGEVYRGGKLFLPELVETLVHEQVVAALATAKTEAEEKGVPFDAKAGVQFAFDIGADSANNAHGYQYTVTPLTAPSANDPLAAMKVALLGNAPPLQIGTTAVALETLNTIHTEPATAETAAPEATSKKK